MKLQQETIFISYSRDSEQHMQWVAGLANALMRYHIKVVYDQNDPDYGQIKYTSMNNLILGASVILIILTPEYKLKTEMKDGKGVGYEYPIILDQVYERGKKVIPVLRHPDFAGSCPIGIAHRQYVDFSTDENYRVMLPSLVGYITGQPYFGREPQAPLPKVDFIRQLSKNVIVSAMSAALFSTFSALTEHTHAPDEDSKASGHAGPADFVRQSIDINIYHHWSQAHTDDHGADHHDEADGHHLHDDDYGPNT